jgi:Taurine catabolism dioxygenase TauD, TfdA family
MAQVPRYPESLFFYCDVAPASGGETPILRSDILYNRVLEKYPEFCARLEEQGVIYSRTIPEADDYTSPVGRGWKSTFCGTNSSDREGAQMNASKLNVTLEWLPNGDCKTVSPVLRNLI